MITRSCRAVRDRRLFPEFSDELVNNMTEEVRQLFEEAWRIARERGDTTPEFERIMSLKLRLAATNGESDKLIVRRARWLVHAEQFLLGGESCRAEREDKPCCKCQCTTHSTSEERTWRRRSESCPERSRQDSNLRPLD